MPLTEDELIEMLKQLIGVEITVVLTQGGVTFKKPTGSEIFKIIEVEGNFVTVKHIASKKETLHFATVINIETPLL